MESITNTNKNENSYDLSDLEEEENSWILTAQQKRIKEANQNENLSLFKFNSTNNIRNHYHYLIQDSSSDVDVDVDDDAISSVSSISSINKMSRINRLKTFIFKNRSNNLTDESESSCNSAMGTSPPGQHSGNKPPLICLDSQPIPNLVPINGNNRDSSYDYNKKNEKLNLSKIKSSAVNTISTVSNKFSERSSYIIEASKRTAKATANNIKNLKIFNSQLKLQSKRESVLSPCPRLVIICCTTIVSSGLETKDIFVEKSPKELVTAVMNQFNARNGAVLPPSGVTPDIMAGVLKEYLSNLNEPLLTYKLIPYWINAGMDLRKAYDVMTQLPIVNFEIFDMLLDTWYRIYMNSIYNEVNLQDLVSALIPCLIWKPESKHIINTSHDNYNYNDNENHGIMKKLFMKSFSYKLKKIDILEMGDMTYLEGERKVCYEGKVLLNEEEMKSVIKVLSYLITEYSSFHD